MSGMNTFTQYDNSMAEFWKQRIQRDQVQHEALTEMLGTQDEFMPHQEKVSRASSVGVGDRDRSCTTGSETGTVRSSVISRLERSLEEESGKRLAIAGELAVLRAQLDRATKQ